MGEEESGNDNQVWERVREHKLELGLGVVGMVLIGVGVKQWMTDRIPDEAVEIVPSEEEVEEVDGEVVVDVGGAVRRPGVYRLGGGSRVGEAIEMAGGLAEEADLGYVSQRVNLAGRVSDGMKIYVPFSGQGDDEEVDQVEFVGGGNGLVESESVVNVNTASEAELDSLWGVGEARAKAIVKNRPYGSIDELRSKAGLPENVISANEANISL